MTDLTQMKMHVIRDEQDTMNEFLDELHEVFEDEEAQIEELFRGPAYNIRYRLPNPPMQDD